MKMIKKGEAPKERIWIGKCRTCKAEFEATGSEINHLQYDSREGTAFSWEVCIYCGAGANKLGYSGVLFRPKDS